MHWLKILLFSLTAAVAVAALVLAILAYLKKDDGSEGTGNSLINAYARVTSTGATLENVGFAHITHPETGVYKYELSTPEKSQNYMVLTQMYEITTQSDINVFVTGQTKSEFTITIGKGDNGGSEDVRINIEHAVMIIAEPSDAQEFRPTDASGVGSNSLFLDKSDDTLKFKNGDGQLQVLPN